MSLAVIEPCERPRKRTHAEQMQEVSDEAAKIYKLHQDGEIDGDEAAKRLKELTTRHRTFLDRLVG